jgi:hypothetical protein
MISVPARMMNEASVEAMRDMDLVSGQSSWGQSANYRMFREGTLDRHCIRRWQFHRRCLRVYKWLKLEKADSSSPVSRCAPSRLLGMKTTIGARLDSAEAEPFRRNESFCSRLKPRRVSKPFFGTTLESLNGRLLTGGYFGCD